MYVAHNSMAANTARNLNAHYANLATSTQRLSSGLRINSAADDSAGLAIRELQRAECAALNQGSRNVNDAISMLQVADGALGIIDEKLIRLRELSEQAASGTYSSTQRLMIDSEFQAMGEEIDRIARSTDFNGIKLIDGEFEDKDYDISLTAEYMVAEFCTNWTRFFKPIVKQKYEWSIDGITDPSLLVGNHNISIRNKNFIKLNDDVSMLIFGFGNNNVSDFTLEYNQSWSINGDRSTVYHFPTGIHYTKIIGTSVSVDGNYINNKTGNIVDINTSELSPMIINWHAETEELTKPFYISDYGSVSADMPNFNFHQDNVISMTIDLSNDIQAGTNVITMDWDISTSNNILNPTTFHHNAIPLINLNLNVIDYTNADPSSPNYAIPNKLVRVHFGPEANKEEDFYDIYKFDATRKGLGIDDIQIQTQESAQKALTRINDAMVKKDKIRAYFGGMQNRLENTLTNVTIQSENLQAAESRISDADIAQEMTNFVKNQILTQSAVAMLSQANSLQQIVMQLIQ